MDGMVKQVERLLQANPQESAVEPYPDGLTEREVEVLQLIMQGKQLFQLTAQLRQ